MPGIKPFDNHHAMNIRPIVAAFALTFTGCAAMIAPTPQQAAAADYGTFPKDARAVVMTYIRDTYKDPYSIQDLQVSEPRKQWIQAPPLLGGGTIYGYLISFSVNAKNSFGAYTGVQTHRLLVRNGRVAMNLDEQMMAN